MPILLYMDEHVHRAITIDLLKAARRQRRGISFGGVLYAHPLRISIGVCVRDLELIAKAGEPEDLRNRVEFLPI